jgi:hypothetical protein
MKKKTEQKNDSEKKNGPTPELGRLVPRAGVCGTRYAPTWSVYGKFEENVTLPFPIEGDLRPVWATGTLSSSPVMLQAEKYSVVS